MTKTNSEEKPQRLYFKSYIQVVRNSIGSNMFPNLYVHTSDRGEFDALDDGEDSCAFFVSSILVIFKKLNGVHGTVRMTIEDLRKSGWQQVDRPEPGDVLVWGALQSDGRPNEHIGLYMGDGRAISNSSKNKTPREHGQNFDEPNRKITHTFRMVDWESGP